MRVLAGIWLVGFTTVLVGAWWLALFSGEWRVVLSFNHFGEAWMEGPLFHGALVFAVWYLRREILDA